MAKHFLRNRKGQTTVEYLLIIAVIVVVISVFGRVAQKRMATTVEAVFNGIDKKISKLMGSANSD